MIDGQGRHEPIHDAEMAMVLVGPLEELIRHQRLVLAEGSYPIAPSPAQSIWVEANRLLIGGTRSAGGIVDTRPYRSEGASRNLIGIGYYVAEPYVQSLLPIAKTGLDELAARAGLTIEIGGTSYDSSNCYMHVALDDQRIIVTVYPQVPPHRGCSSN